MKQFLETIAGILLILVLGAFSIFACWVNSDYEEGVIKMKYKIEIWKYRKITETFESDDIKRVLKWYKENWKDAYDNKICAFSLYANKKELKYEEIKKLGFFE